MREQKNIEAYLATDAFFEERFFEAGSTISDTFALPLGSSN